MTNYITCPIMNKLPSYIVISNRVFRTQHDTSYLRVAAANP